MGPPKPNSDTPPSARTLSKALNHPLYTSPPTSTLSKSTSLSKTSSTTTSSTASRTITTSTQPLPSNKPTTLSAAIHQANTPRTLVILIRNFLCGNCQSYLHALSTVLPPSSLPADLSIVIIGHGAPSLLPSYLSLISEPGKPFPYPIYTDPSHRLYDILGCQKSLSLGSRSPSYIKQNLLLGGLKSVVQGLRRIGQGDVMGGGDMGVNGGEFLFVRDGAGIEVEKTMGREAVEVVGEKGEVVPLVAVIEEQHQTPETEGETVHEQTTEAQQLVQGQGTAAPEQQPQSIEEAQTSEAGRTTETETTQQEQQQTSTQAENLSKQPQQQSKSTSEAGSNPTEGSNSPTWNVTWCHRMQNTRDHTEIEDIKTILSIPSSSTTTITQPQPSPTSQDTDIEIEKPVTTAVSSNPRGTTSKLSRALSRRSSSFISTITLTRSHSTVQSGQEGRPQPRQKRFHSYSNSTYFISPS